MYKLLTEIADLAYNMQTLKNSLIIHEENTKEITVYSMFVNRIKICPDLHKLQL
jgi:hypothetical protein